MKKILAILLVLIMTFSLVACGEKAKPQEQDNQTTPNVDSVNKPDGNDTQDSDGTKPDNSGTTSADGGTIGYITDEVDHFARDTYEIVYMYNSPTNLTRYMLECMQNLSDKLNINVTDVTANGDANLYISNIDAVLLTEPDGLVVDMVYEYQSRIMEILDASGVPYVSLFNSVQDENGSELVPVVMMNQLLNGQKQAEFLGEVYKDYWGDIDKKEIGQIILTYSLNEDLQTRERGAREKFEEMFPGNQVFVADAVTAGAMNAQAAFDLTSGVISANPEIKYWFINSVVEDMSIGAARATESLGKQDCVLITGSGSSVLPGEWDAGYEGNWIANFAVSNYQYAVPAVCGIIAMADGRATAETLWEDMKRPEDKCAQFVVGQDMITHDNYQSYFKEIEEGFGIEK